MVDSSQRILSEQLLIPVHLLTKEAIETYSKHLKDEGILALHITNKYLDLAPVVFGSTDLFGFKGVEVTSSGDRNMQITASNWVLLTRDGTILNEMKGFDEVVLREPSAHTIIWTDDFSNIFSILK